MQTILVVSAHPDDETFGMGGTLARLCYEKKSSIYWLNLTQIWFPKWNKEQIISRKKAVNTISSLLEIKEIIQWDYKDNYLETYPINDLQEKLIRLLDKIQPSLLFCPSPFDFNHEHKLAYSLVEMSTKPYYSPYVKKILCYEIPSSTDASFKAMSVFSPNSYVDISSFIEKKMDLIKQYDTELHDFPHPRSYEYIKSLATVRGAEAGVAYAEAFKLLRSIE